MQRSHSASVLDTASLAALPALALGLSLLAIRFDPTVLIPRSWDHWFQMVAAIAVWLICFAYALRERPLHELVGPFTPDPWAPPRRRTAMIAAFICLLGAAISPWIAPLGPSGMTESMTIAQAGQLAACASIPLLAAIGAWNRLPRIAARLMACSFVILAAGWLCSALPSAALMALAMLPFGLAFGPTHASSFLDAVIGVALMIFVASLPLLYFWISTYCGYAALKLWRCSEVDAADARS